MLGQLVFVAWAKVDENVKLQSQIHVQCHLVLTQCHGLLKSLHIWSPVEDPWPGERRDKKTKRPRLNHEKEDSAVPRL